jgi:hypothetical protein
MSDDAPRPYPPQLENTLLGLGQALAKHNEWLGALDVVAHDEATAIRDIAERLTKLENIVSHLVRAVAGGDGVVMH